MHDVKRIYVQAEKAGAEPSLLKVLQNKILNNSIYNFKKELTNQDTSLQVIACPTIYREIEYVYNSIIYNINNYSNLLLTDIAVLAFDLNKYSNVIKSVFGRTPVESFEINTDINHKSFLAYNLSDSSAKNESIFGQALLKGLLLVKSNFSRKDFFDFINNPFFLHSQKITQKEISIFLNWIDKLNIFYGYDEENKMKYSFNDSPLFTWELGLKRLRYGRIMEDIESNGIKKDFDGIIPFNDIDTEDKSLLNKFISSI